MGSTFSSAFDNIHVEFRFVGSIFSSAFDTIPTLNVELRVQHLALHLTPYTLWISSYGLDISFAFENIHLEYRAVRSTFSSAFKIIHTWNIELLVWHSALHTKTFISNIELWDRHSSLHSTPYTFWISSYGTWMNYINYLDALLYEREQKQSKMHFLTFSIQNLSEQILSCLKIGQDQCRVIIYINFKRITTQMRHSFKAIRQVALEKNVFKGFTIYEHSSHLGPVTWKKYKKKFSPPPFSRKLHLKF